MGQRHMTYVLVKGGCDHDAMLALYNQWNYETIQPIKVVRFLMALKQWEAHKALVMAEDVANLYVHAASVTPCGLSHFSQENALYDERYGMYDEDNNNGWQIVYVKYDADRRTYKVHVGFKPGYEWRNDYESQGYLSLKDYFDGYVKARENCKFKSFDDFVASHTPEEQALLKEISRSFNQHQITIAEKQIRKQIEALQAAKTKKAHVDAQPTDSQDMSTVG